MVAYFLLLGISIIAGRMNFCDGIFLVPFGLITKLSSNAGDNMLKGLRGGGLFNREESFTAQVDAYIRDPVNNRLPIARNIYEQQHIDTILKLQEIEDNQKERALREKEIATKEEAIETKEKEIAAIKSSQRSWDSIIVIFRFLFVIRLCRGK